MTDPCPILAALLALAACTPTAEWPEGRGTDRAPPAQEWHGMPEPNPPSFEREAD